MRQRRIRSTRPRAAGRQIVPLAVTLALLAASLSPAPVEGASPEGLEPLLRELSVRPLWGDPPPLTFPGLDGQRHSLDDLKGRVVLLYFWATW